MAEQAGNEQEKTREENWRRDTHHGLISLRETAIECLVHVNEESSSLERGSVWDAVTWTLRAGTHDDNARRKDDSRKQTPRENGRVLRAGRPAHDGLVDGIDAESLRGGTCGMVPSSSASSDGQGGQIGKPTDRP